MAHIRFRLTGSAPLLMHNVQLANPLNEYAREMAKITKKRTKTESDYLALSKIEFEGGLYFDEEIGPYAPSSWIDAALIGGGKKEKLGVQFEAFSRCIEDRIPLEYDGPRSIKGLWEAGFFDQRCIGIKNNKTLRTRPCFTKWAIECTVLYDESALERDQVIRAMEKAGESSAIGDYRPRFGRFTTEVVQDDIKALKHAA